MVYTRVKSNRLPLALAMAMIGLALQSAGATLAFALSVPSVGGVTTALVPANAAINCQKPPVHDSCRWAGNEAFGKRGTYRQASVEFKIPKIAGNNLDHISFWAGVGGDPPYAGKCKGCVVLVQAGVDSYLMQNGTQFTQVNYAWYEVTTPTCKTCSQTPVNFTRLGGLETGDRITITVSSNYNAHKGVNWYSITDERSHEKHSGNMHGPMSRLLSDSATGECIGERVTGLNGLDPIADFGTEWLNNCRISTDSKTKPAGSWPTNWYHIVNTRGKVLVGIGGVDKNGSFPLHWKQAE